MAVRYALQPSRSEKGLCAVQDFVRKRLIVRNAGQHHGPHHCRPSPDRLFAGCGLGQLIYLATDLGGQGCPRVVRRADQFRAQSGERTAAPDGLAMLRAGGHDGVIAVGGGSAPGLELPTVLVSIIRAGESFAEALLFTGVAQYPVSATALKTSQVASLHGTQYQSAVDDLTDQIAALDIRRLRLQAELAGDTDFTAPPDLAARVPDIVASERALLMARETDLASRTAGAQAVMDQAAREHDMIRRMYDRGLAPEIELTRAEKALADARARLDDITTAADLARADEYATTQGDLASLRQRLKLSQDQLARTILTAPMRGIVNRIMRELGPLPKGVPPFPLAGNAIGALRAQTEKQGLDHCTPLWAGQNVSGCREMPAGQLTRELAAGWRA